jgi:hypothetical protein
LKFLRLFETSGEKNDTFISNSSTAGNIFKLYPIDAYLLHRYCDNLFNFQQITTL